jgi:hypothetical protein
MADKDLTLRFKVTDQGTVLLDKISQKISNVDDAAKKMGGSLSLIKWDSIVNLGARALQAGERFYDFSRSIASSLNDIDRQAKVIGMSTDEFQKWNYAAKMADVSNEELAKGFKFLSRNMSEAAQGSGNAYDSFKAMGLEVTGVAGTLKPLNDMMKEVMDKFAGWADGPEKIALSLALFGRSGETLIPLLNKGSAGFAEFAKEAEKLGIILGKDLIDKGSLAEDSFKKLESRMTALKLSIGPVAKGFIDLFSLIVSGASSAANAMNSVMDITAKARTWQEEKIIGALKGIGVIKPKKDDLSSFDVVMRRLSKTMAPLIINEAQRKQIGEMKALISNMGWEDYAAGAALATEGTREFNKMLIETRGPIEALNDAFKGLGVESSASLRLSTDITLRNLETIKKAFQGGSATALDYAKALKAALSATEKVTGPDTTKRLADLMAESEKRIAGISPEDPERKKKIEAIVDDWAKARNEIQALEPVSLIADIPKMEAELNLAKDKAKSILGEILPDPIAITVDTSQLESAFDSARSQFESLKQSLSQTIEINVKATVESSPKVPFSKGIENMILKFGSVKKSLSDLEANIRFPELETQITKMKDFEKARDVIPSTRRMPVDPYIESQKRIAEISPEDPGRAKKIQAIIDQWTEAREKLDEIAKPPIPINVNIAQGLATIDQWIEARQKIGEGQAPISVDVDIAPGIEELNHLMEARQKIGEGIQGLIPVKVDIQGLAEMDRMTDKYEAMKQQIESNPIQSNIMATIESSDTESGRKIAGILSDPIPVTADTSYLKPAFDSTLSQFESLKENIEAQAIEINARATIESSPKVPFSQGIENMIKKFGTVEGAMKALEFNISMANFKQSLAPLLKELAEVKDIVPSIKYAQSMFPTLDKSIDQKYLLRIKEREEDIQGQINLIKMQMSLKTLGMYKEMGSFQSGTDFVPKTGL